MQKNKWTKISLGNLCELYQPKTISKNELNNDGKYNVWGANGVIGKFDKYNHEEEQVLISCRGEKCGVINFSNKFSWITGNSMVAKPKDDKALSKNFLYFLLSGIDLNSTINGTAQPQITRGSITNLKISLPPIEEQTQIAELFQNIETTIERTEQQEKNLLKLKKTLSNGLVSKEPEFGSLLSKKNCTPTNFGGVADCIEQHDKQKKDVNRFIGLENIEPENLSITTWGNIIDGTTFTKKFSKGDVLFGKRRAYLKKVAIADFDGICSGDILVLRAKEKKILQELFPFYVSAELFINHAVRTSAGSLSPRTKWKDLSLFEISIPDLKTQEIILEVFQQIETTLSQLKTQNQTLKNLKQKLLNEILG